MTRLFLFLMLSITLPLASADIDFPQPPYVLISSDINNAKPVNILLERIQALVKSGSEEKINAQPILVDDQQIIIAYEYTYGWRATDVAEQTLIYKKMEQDWQLSATLNGTVKPESFVGDLTGDGISELLVINSGGFRNQIEETQVLMLFDSTQKKYVPSGLEAHSMATRGECNEVDNNYEKISIGKSQHSPVVIITKEIKRINPVECEEKTTGTSTKEYAWAPEQNQFVQISSETLAENGQKKELSEKLDNKQAEESEGSFWDWLSSWK